MERHKGRLCTLYFLCCGEDRTQRKTKVNGQFQTLNIPIPPMLKNYIAGMGGVDLSDQLLQCYQALPRTRKWWKHFFFYFMDISAPNAYIVHKKITEGMTHKDFRQCLANELLERSELQLNSNPSPGRPLRSSVHEVITSLGNLQRQHLGEQIVNCAASFSRRSKRLPGGVGLMIFHYVSSLTETVLRNGTLLSVTNSEIDSSDFNKALTRMCLKKHFSFKISENCIIWYLFVLLTLTGKLYLSWTNDCFSNEHLI